MQNSTLYQPRHCLAARTSRPLEARVKRPRHALSRRLSGPQSRSGRFGEDKILWPQPGTEVPFLGYPARIIATITNYATLAPGREHMRSLEKEELFLIVRFSDGTLGDKSSLRSCEKHSPNSICSQALIVIHGLTKEMLLSIQCLFYLSYALSFPTIFYLKQHDFSWHTNVDLSSGHDILEDKTLNRSIARKFS